MCMFYVTVPNYIPPLFFRSKQACSHLLESRFPLRSGEVVHGHSSPVDTSPFQPSLISTYKGIISFQEAFAGSARSGREVALLRQVDKEENLMLGHDDDPL